MTDNAGPSRGRVWLILLVMAGAAVFLGYRLWVVFEHRQLTPGRLAPIENTAGALLEIKATIDFVPPTNARVLWNGSDSGWDGTQVKEWILFVPKGSIEREAVMAGIGHGEGTVLTGDLADDGGRMARDLGIRTIGVPRWRYQSQPWDVQPKGGGKVEVVETDEGFCVYARWLWVQ